MKKTNPVDAARIELMLSDLRLPAIKSMWAKLAEQSDKEGWPAARFLAALAEHEIADRGVLRDDLDENGGGDLDFEAAAGSGVMIVADLQLCKFFRRRC